MAKSTLLSDQVMFYSWLGAVFVLLGQSIIWGSKEQDKGQQIGWFLLALGLFFFAFAVYARGCNACEDSSCTRAPFRPALLVVMIGAITIFVSSLYMGHGSDKPNPNSGIAAVSFVIGWALVASAIALQKREQKSKAVFASLVGVGLVLAGELWLRSQNNQQLVNAPGWIFGTMGVAFLAVGNSLN